MWIRSQNEEVLLNSDYISSVWYEPNPKANDYEIFAREFNVSYFLGHFAREDDACKVLKDIQQMTIFRGRKEETFDIPEEGEI